MADGGDFYKFDLTFGRSVKELKLVGFSLCVEGHGMIGILCVLGNGVDKKENRECQKDYLGGMYERQRYVIHAHLQWQGPIQAPLSVRQHGATY